MLDTELWDSDAIPAHPLVNTETLSIPTPGLMRFLELSGHPPVPLVRAAARSCLTSDTGSISVMLSRFCRRRNRCLMLPGSGILAAGEYVYGTDANAFLREEAHRLPAGGQC